MNREYYEEMIISLEQLETEGNLESKRIYLFGHCDATENLVNLLLKKGYKPAAILDNNVNKHGKFYNGIRIEPPAKILEDRQEQTFVCIVARAYAAMDAQLKRMGYKGQIRKLVDYDSYAEYSLSNETISKMRTREAEGEIILNNLKKKYPHTFIILCPFCALGDIYIMMSYLPIFLKKRGINKCVVGVIGNACEQVVKLFGEYEVEKFCQKDMDKTIQAALFTNDFDVFIPHQDRPYVVDLYKALYIRKIPLDEMYCCGVFGMPKETMPVKPTGFKEYCDIMDIPEGKSVILSPYAKSVTALPDRIWNEIVSCYKVEGYTCFTNVIGNEKPLDGTTAISTKIAEIKSVVERAGTFVGIRSGLCDVLRTAKAKMIALYPDYNYCDTKWKSIDIYSIDDWDNRVVKEGFVWQMN